MKAVALAALVAASVSGCEPCGPGAECLVVPPEVPSTPRVDSAICGRFCGTKGAEPYNYLGPCTADEDAIRTAALEHCKSAVLFGCLNTVCKGCVVYASATCKPGS